jgi:hypothetical protein
MSRTGMQSKIRRNRRGAESDLGVGGGIASSDFVANENEPILICHEGIWNCAAGGFGSTMQE